VLLMPVCNMKVMTMVSSSYLDRKPAPPSGLKRFFDQRVIPMAIDGAAGLEIGVASAGRHLRRNPAMSLGLALGMGILLALVVRQRRVA
jgi:hypothetical protein